MTKMLQVRNLPDDVHEALRRKAAEAGMSLSEYAARQLRRAAMEPSLEDIFARAERRGGRYSFEHLNDIVRTDRDAH